MQSDHFIDHQALCCHAVITGIGKDAAMPSAPVSERLCECSYRDTKLDNVDNCINNAVLQLYQSWHLESRMV